MLVHLASAQDVDNFLGLGDGMPEGRSHTVVEVDMDFPETMRAIVPAVDGDPAREVTAVRVKLSKYSDDEPGEGFEVQATVFGHPLTKAGKRSASASHGSILVDLGCPIRWELRRAAVANAIAYTSGFAGRKVGWGSEMLLPHAEVIAERKAQYKREAEAWAARKAEIKAEVDA